jgi:hypothetical protein
MSGPEIHTSNTKAQPKNISDFYTKMAEFFAESLK